MPGPSGKASELQTGDAHRSTHGGSGPGRLPQGRGERPTPSKEATTAGIPATLRQGPGSLGLNPLFHRPQASCSQEHPAEAHTGQHQTPEGPIPAPPSPGPLPPPSPTSRYPLHAPSAQQPDEPLNRKSGRTAVRLSAQQPSPHASRHELRTPQPGFRVNPLPTSAGLPSHPAVHRLWPPQDLRPCCTAWLTGPRPPPSSRRHLHRARPDQSRPRLRAGHASAPPAWRLQALPADLLLL